MALKLQFHSNFLERLKKLNIEFDSNLNLVNYCGLVICPPSALVIMDALRFKAAFMNL